MAMNEVQLSESVPQMSSVPPSLDETKRTEFQPDLPTFTGPHATVYKEGTVIGQGAYGTVYKAKDVNNPDGFVALKKVRLPLDDNGVPVFILREIALVRQLDRYQHPNIVRFFDVLQGARQGNERSFTLFLVFEFVEMNLLTYIQTCTDELTPSKIKDILFQILCGVDFLHSLRIIHRDLKPENLLISKTGQVKIADFGLSKIYDFKMRLTSVVVTLWYRPPEVLLGCSYTTSIDLWSVGCIFAELLNKRALFPGESERDQLDKIFDVIGTPSIEDWPSSAMVLPHAFPPRPSRNLDLVVPEISCKGKELLSGLLTFKGSQRISAQQALHHPYFEGLEIPVVEIRKPLVESPLNKTLNNSTSPDDSGYASMHSQ